MKKPYLLLLLILLVPFIPNLNACDSTQIIAHRGASGLAPENTLPAFQLAIDIGVDYIELDVRKSSDDSLMVIHDATLNATTNGSGNVSALSYVQLKSLDAGSWFGPAFVGAQIPSLYEVLLLAKLNQIKVCVEMKDAGLEAAVVALIQQLGMVDAVILFSFSLTELQVIKQLNPLLKICWLDNTISIAEINQLQAIGGEYVGAGNIPALSSIKYAQNLQIGFLIWTINDPEQMMLLMSKGVAGIITDDPQEMIGLQTYMGRAQGGLRAYWSFDEPIGNLIYDYSGHQNTLVLNGGTRVAGQVQLAVALNGSTDYASVPLSAALDITDQALSMSVWLKLDKFPSAISGSFGPIYDSDQDAYILYLDKSNASLRFKIKDDDGDTERPEIPETMLDTGRWMHVVGVYNGDEAMLYLDGQLIDYHENTALDYLLGGQQARLGENGGDYFEGAMDEMKVYNRALSPAEVRALYAQQQGFCSDNLAIEFSLDAFNLSVLTDTIVCDSVGLNYAAPLLPRVIYEFDGIRDYINTSATTGYLAGGSHAFFGWFKTSNSNFDERIMAFNGAGTGNSNVCLFGILNGKVDVYNGAYFTGNTLVNDGNWHHLGYTWNHINQQLQIWVDGVLDANYTTNLMISSTDISSLGQEFDGFTLSNLYQGYMAEISIWDTVFSGSTVQYIMQHAIDSSYPSFAHLIAQYNTVTACPNLLKSTAAYPTDGFSCPAIKTSFEYIPGHFSTDYNCQWTSDSAGVFSTADSVFYTAVSTQGIQLTMGHYGSVQFVDSAVVVVSTCTSDGSLEASSKSKVFPNPSVRFLHIEAPSKIEKYQIFDTTGRLLKRGYPRSIQQTIDLLSLKNGVYYLQCQSSRGIEYIPFVKIAP